MTLTQAGKKTLLVSSGRDSSGEVGEGAKKNYNTNARTGFGPSGMGSDKHFTIITLGFSPGRYGG